MSRAAEWAVAVLLCGLLGSAGAAAQQLVADLSDHLIAISTDFTGASVVLFGTVDEPGDVAVVVLGPPTAVTVRRKAQVAGIWMNRDSLTFTGVPSFYVVASNRPLSEFADPALLGRHGIGVEHLRLEPIDADGLSEAEIAGFREALVRSRQRAGVFGSAPGQVTFLGEHLFRTDIHFPSNLPTGQYTVSVYVFRDGEVVAAQSTPLIVSQIGLGAMIVRFAYRQAALYGVVAVLLAVLAGWGAGLIFRRARP